MQDEQERELKSLLLERIRREGEVKDEETLGEVLRLAKLGLELAAKYPGSEVVRTVDGREPLPGDILYSSGYGCGGTPSTLVVLSRDLNHDDTLRRHRWKVACFSGTGRPGSSNKYLMPTAEQSAISSGEPFWTGASVMVFFDEDIARFSFLGTLPSYDVPEPEPEQSP